MFGRLRKELCFVLGFRVMMNKNVFILGVILALFSCAVFADPYNPRVEFETNLGRIVIELYADVSPYTVANFMNYVLWDFYDDTIIHRKVNTPADGNSPAFSIVQGGGFVYDEPNDAIYYKPPYWNPIQNQSDNGLSNVRGTIAMARTAEPHSATSQFFINQIDNVFLDYQSIFNVGYCVFGEVVYGMDVIDKIAEMSNHLPETYCTDYNDVNDCPFTTVPNPSNYPVVVVEKASMVGCRNAHCADNYYDGIVNFSDFLALAENWLSTCTVPDFCLNTDFSHNGIVNEEDFMIFVNNWLYETGEDPLSSDMTYDLSIDFSDFTVISEYWGRDDCWGFGEQDNNFCNGADINRDGFVNYDDVMLFAQNWLAL